LANEHIRAARDELERRVRERTGELETANAALRAEIERRRAAEAAREQLLHRLTTAEENERLRLARELHDELGQHLAALMLRLNTLESSADAAGQLGVLREAQGLVETIGRDIHRIAVELRPTALDDVGLTGALGSYIELWSAQSGIPVRTQLLDADDARLSRELELALYRIVQESLTNILKHAAATSVSVVMSRTDGHVVVVVEDDGRGFNPESETTASPGGLGIIGMRERAAQFRGEVVIESQPGKGTTVFVRIPVSRP
jgi:signal transduction histidine kinase